MQQDRIDAAVTTEPTVSRLIKMGMATVLVDMRTAAGTRVALGGTYPAACLYMRSDYVTSHKDAVQRTVSAFVKTLQYLQTHQPPVVTEHMPEDYYVGDKPLYLAALAASMNMFNPAGMMPPDGPPTVLKVLAAFNKELDPGKVDLSKTYTDAFVNTALARKQPRTHRRGEAREEATRGVGQIGTHPVGVVVVQVGGPVSAPQLITTSRLRAVSPQRLHSPMSPRSSAPARKGSMLLCAISPLKSPAASLVPSPHPRDPGNPRPSI